MKFDNRIYKGIAHRGLHDELFPENSLGAFKAAIDKDLAFECDVHITKDRKLIVIHDFDLKRMTGRDGVVERLTLKEIKENYKLPDGSSLPTLDEVLEIHQNKVPLFIELKVPLKRGYVYSLRVAKAVRHCLKRHHVKRELITLISFDPRALAFSRHRYHRGLLITEKRPSILIFRHLYEMLDVELPLISHKSVQKFAKKKKVLNCYTIDNEADLKKYAPLVSTLTFENIDPEIVKNALGN